LFTIRYFLGQEAGIKLALLSQNEMLRAEGIGALPNAYFLHRQAARERKAAASAVTEAARERHRRLAVHFAQRAEQLQAAHEAKSGERPAG
jgi:hypothetical protein